MPGTKLGIPRGPAIVILALGALFLLPACSDSGAQVGDHWHASITVEICGQGVEVPPSSGGIHSHGDGSIHIHPNHPSSAGTNANLGLFAAGLQDMLLEPERIQPPGGPVLENGDPCPDGTPGQVRVFANGKDITETFRSYVPADEDRIEVRFD